MDRVDNKASVGEAHVGRPRTPIGTVIIPAHNEAAVIVATLEALVAGMMLGELEIIVACNACSDRTAELARALPGIQVLETDIPGKANALNMADERARYFPRIYLDADVRIDIDTIRALVDVLSKGHVHVAAPSLTVDVAGRPWLVRAYYQIWTQLPYCTQGMVGSGVYALSETGRSRFEEFPKLLAEDDFIRLLFAPDERLTLAGHHFMISAPTQFRALLKLRRRWERSNRQIDSEYPTVRCNDRRDYRPFFKSLSTRPSLWLHFLVYALTLATARLGAAWQLRFSSNPWEWTRDDSAREKLKRTDSLQ